MSVLCTNSQLFDMQRFCTDSIHFSPISVDHTFDLGDLCVTVISYQKNKRTRKNPMTQRWYIPQHSLKDLVDHVDQMGYLVRNICVHSLKLYQVQSVKQAFRMVLLCSRHCMVLFSITRATITVPKAFVQ